MVACSFSICAEASWRNWEFINPSDLEIRISPERKELPAGDIASFTISIRNKTDKPVNIYFPTGQRWDMAGFHNGAQIFRWSQGLRWYEAPHSIPIQPGEVETQTLSWTTLDRVGCALPQGIYKAEGMVMTVPRHFVSNSVSFRLLPPRVIDSRTLKVKINQTFEIQVPKVLNDTNISWRIEYDYNDHRVSPIEHRVEGKNTILVFEAKRIGYVIMRLYGYPEFKFHDLSVERRTYRIDVVAGE